MGSGVPACVITHPKSKLPQIQFYVPKQFPNKSDVQICLIYLLMTVNAKKLRVNTSQAGIPDVALMRCRLSQGRWNAQY